MTPNWLRAVSALMALVAISGTSLTSPVLAVRISLKTMVTCCLPFVSDVAEMIETIEPKLPSEEARKQYRTLLGELAADSSGKMKVVYRPPNYELDQLRRLANKQGISGGEQLREQFGGEFLNTCRLIARGYEETLAAAKLDCDDGCSNPNRPRKIKMADKLTEVYRFCKYLTEFSYSSAIESVMTADQETLGGQGRWNALRLMDRFGDRLFGASESLAGLEINKAMVCPRAREVIALQAGEELPTDERLKFIQPVIGEQARKYRYIAGGLRDSCLVLSDQLHDVDWMMQSGYLGDETRDHLSAKAQRVMATLEACTVLSGCNWDDLGVGQ